ncbi:MAG: helix-turn-helix domain-containing protein [Clostridiales bacterium]|nr:helix-turn-helix domain-containing protein [Clostridiales bacterium]
MNKKEIGSRIKEARVKRNLTQDQLAEKVDRVTTYISDIERGSKLPSLSLFINIVEVLNVSADYILRGEIDAGKQYVYDDIIQSLEGLNPKQRLGVIELIHVYIKNLD